MIDIRVKAERLMAEHGRKATQLLVDRIVAGIRSGDEAAALEAAETLRLVEDMLIETAR